MKVRMAVLSASILGLAACATTGQTTSYTPAQDQPSITDDDEEYMARVEAYARRRGIVLIWANPPRRDVVAQKDE
ncbi:MAG TPA: hypothetical protein VJ484_01630 [Lysobacter sp.]|nr:hypothetical protein [Lysobacter sp.]